LIFIGYSRWCVELEQSAPRDPTSDEFFVADPDSDEGRPRQVAEAVDSMLLIYGVVPIDPKQTSKTAERVV
jgi:hypothetical protein